MFRDALNEMREAENNFPEEDLVNDDPETYEDDLSDEVKKARRFALGKLVNAETDIPLDDLYSEVQRKFQLEFADAKDAVDWAVEEDHYLFQKEKGKDGVKESKFQLGFSTQAGYKETGKSFSSLEDAKRFAEDQDRKLARFLNYGGSRPKDLIFSEGDVPMLVDTETDKEYAWEEDDWVESEP